MDRNNKKKGQVSVEYVMIFGFVTAITIPMILIYYEYMNLTNDEIILQQVYNIVQKVTDTSESIYYLGEPTQTKLKIYLPDRIEDAFIHENSEIVYKVKTKSGYSTVGGVSSVNITGELPIKRGVHYVTIKAVDNYINITFI